MLRGVARLLIEHTRTIDIVGRYGGEGSGSAAGDRWRRRSGSRGGLRERVEATVLHRLEREGMEAESLRCTISLGVPRTRGGLRVAGGLPERTPTGALRGETRGEEPGQGGALHYSCASGVARRRSSQPSPRRKIASYAA